MSEIDVITSLINAISERAWYPVVGLGLTLIVAILRMVTPEAWSQLPRWAKPIPAVALACITAFVSAFESGLGWEQALGIGIYTLVGSTLVAVGAADTFTRLLGKRTEVTEGKLDSTSQSVSSVGKSTLAPIETQRYFE